MNQPNNPQNPARQEVQVTPDEQPYDGFEGNFPGDGSGMDDLADFNQNEANDYRDE
jgi:hypothetical protein